MKNHFNFNFKESVKKIGIGNLIIILVFIIALVFFIFFSIQYYWNKIFNNREDIEVTYDYQNEDLYSIESDNEKYKLDFISNYETFYNIEDIIKAIYLNLLNNNYEGIYNIFSEDYKSKFSSKEEALNQLNSMRNSFNFDLSFINKGFLKEVYNLDNSNIYICYINENTEDLRKLILNIDFIKDTYTIDNIYF